MVIAQQPFCWKRISITKVSKYGQNEYSRALNASYTLQPLMGFCVHSISVTEKSSGSPQGFSVLLNPNHILLAGVNNRNVIIIQRFYAAPDQANLDFFWRLYIFNCKYFSAYQCELLGCLLGILGAINHPL